MDRQPLYVAGRALGWVLDALLAVADAIARWLDPLEDPEPDDPLAS